MLALKLALERAPQYQAQIKDWVFHRTGYHIAFSHVWPAFRWYGPELYFDELELRSPDDRRVLARAGGGRIGADIWQLLQNGKLFALRVELDAPAMAIQRLGPSRFALGSEIVWGDEPSSLSRLALNDLPAGTLVIRRGRIVLQDWNAALPRLELHDVNLDVTRVAHFASASLSAQLPAQLGGRLSVSGTARGAERIVDLRWNALASASGMSFHGWRELLPDYLTRLDAGTGAFQALARGQGADIEGADLEFSASGVVARLAERSNAAMDQVSGSLSLAHAGDRWTLAGRRLRAVTAGRRDPDSEFDASWRESDAGMLELHAEANYLRAEALLPLVGLMPQKDVRERLRDLAPTGEWSDMRLSLARASVSDAWRFDARAKFRDMGFAPVGRAPGLRGLSGSLVGHRSGGARDHRHAFRGLQLARSVSRAHRTAGAQDDALLETKRAGAAHGDLGSRAAHARGARAREARLVAARRRKLPRIHPGELHRRRQRRRCAALFPAAAASARRAAMAGSGVRRRAISRTAMPFSRDRYGAFRFATAGDCSSSASTSIT